MLEYHPHRKFGVFKRLWRHRYRVFVVLVIIFSLFIVQSDTPRAIKVLVSEDSLTSRVLETNVFAKKVKQYGAGDTQLVDSIVYNNGFAQYYDKNGKRIVDPIQTKFWESYGVGADPIAASLLESGVINPKLLPYQNNTDSLNSLIKAPANPEKINLIEYPRFLVSAPILYTKAEDIYQADAGIIDYSKPINEDPLALRRGNFTSTPVLRLLIDGVVQMGGIPGIPLPGEKGNSYIVGHSSNYSSVVSPYNEVFAPLVGRAQNGDEFVVWDQLGRKLTFRVFSVEEIPFDADPEIAYKRLDPEYKERRVVTLQTCRTTYANGVWSANIRVLVRGELKVQ
jgi:Sortase domain